MTKLRYPFSPEIEAAHAVHVAARVERERKNTFELKHLQRTIRQKGTPAMGTSTLSLSKYFDKYLLASFKNLEGDYANSSYDLAKVEAWFHFSSKVDGKSEPGVWPEAVVWPEAFLWNKREFEHRLKEAAKAFPEWSLYLYEGRSSYYVIISRK